ncbi:MAG: hypothetical protein KDA29_04345 [Phycisphaerales bacterium]|nr:hypothetical protein [Phycisphaerales bacterium]
MITARTAVLSTVALLAPLTMSGCLISSSNQQSVSGAYVQPGTVSKVQLHESTMAEVEELMGQPSASKVNDDGTETWTWNWSKTTDGSGTVFLIFSGSSEKTVHESVHVKFKDGVVVKKWRD